MCEGENGGFGGRGEGLRYDRGLASPRREEMKMRTGGNLMSRACEEVDSIFSSPHIGNHLQENVSSIVPIYQTGTIRGKM